MPDPSPKSTASEADAAPAAAGDKRRKVVKVDPASARILKRLDQLEQRLADQRQLTESSDPAAGERLEELHRALQDQNTAIACIASAVSGLQASLAEQISETVTESIRQHKLSEPPAGPEVEDPSETSTTEKSPTTRPAPATDSASAGSSSDSPGDRWAQIRAAFLADNDDVDNDGESTRESTSEEAADTVPEPPPVTSSCERDESSVSVDPAAEREVEQTQAILNAIPTLVEAARVPDEELRSVLVDRDRFIAMLTGRLQSTLRRSQPLTNQQLKDVSEMAPEEVQQRIEQTLNALDSQVRLGELELSLERARIARQASTLESTREKLAAAARAIGLTLHDDGTLEGETEASPRGSRGRNWLGAMGFGN